IVSVAAVTPGKGYDVLVSALAAVSHQNWRLTCAGSVERHSREMIRVRAAVHAAGLDRRITFVGELDRAALDRLLDTADLVVHASLHETYGMAVAEALARGLPVV